MRKAMIFMCLILAGFFLSWTFYSKWNEKRIAAQNEEQKAALDPAFAKAYGENQLKILGFYANPGTIHPGQKTQLCYSVINAESVRIEPPVKDVWPSLSRCVDAMPKKETVYKLIAEDAGGRIQTATSTVKLF